MGFDMSVSAAAGNECSDNIKRIQEAFDTLTSTPEGFLSAKSLFNCEADMDLVDFFYMIADSWSMMIQYSAKTAFCAAIDLPEEASVEEVAKNFAAYSNSYWGSNFCAGGFYNTKQLKDPARWEVNSRYAKNYNSIISHKHSILIALLCFLFVDLGATRPARRCRISTLLPLLDRCAPRR